MKSKSKTPYQIAVDRAQEYLSGGLDIWVERQKHIHVSEKAQTAETFASEPEMRVRWTGYGVEALIAASDTDPVAFDALIFIACDLVECGRAIPEPLASFVISVLRTKKKRPNKSSRYASSNEWRDNMIALAVVHVDDLGLPATHNDATSGGISACAAVAEALERATGKSFKYRTVKDIWQDFKRPTPPLDKETLEAIARVYAEPSDGPQDYYLKSKKVSRIIKLSRP